MANPSVDEITADTNDVVEHFLIRNGFDGLYAEGECACLVNDLAPCGEIQDDCKAGYKVKCPGHENKNQDDNCHLDGDCGFHIQEKKPGE